MRIRPLIGEKLWFAPRRDVLGWGWTPVSWEGWLCTAAAVVVSVIVAVQAEARDMSDWVAITAIFAVVLVLVAVCFVKGTRPGGRKRFDEYRRITVSSPP